jgi:hypothetical protein
MKKALVMVLVLTVTAYLAYLSRDARPAIRKSDTGSV